MVENGTFHSDHVTKATFRRVTLRHIILLILYKALFVVLESLGVRVFERLLVSVGTFCGTAPVGEWVACRGWYNVLKLTNFIPKLRNREVARARPDS